MQIIKLIKQLPAVRSLPVVEDGGSSAGIAADDGELHACRYGDGGRRADVQVVDCSTHDREARFGRSIHQIECQCGYAGEEDDEK